MERLPEKSSKKKRLNGIAGVLCGALCFGVVEHVKDAPIDKEEITCCINEYKRLVKIQNQVIDYGRLIEGDKYEMLPFQLEDHIKDIDKKIMKLSGLKKNEINISSKDPHELGVASHKRDLDRWNPVLDMIADVD